MAQPTLPSPPVQALPIHQQKDGDDYDDDDDDDGGEFDDYHVDDSGGDHTLPFTLKALYSEALALGK